jgi:hypothetical protein
MTARTAAIRSAFLAGQAFAESLAVGDTWLGTMPEAQRRYPGDKLLRTAFEVAAWAVLENVEIFTSPDDGRIVRLERKS